MVKSNLSISEKLEKLEKQKNDLIDSRRRELLKIIESTGSLAVNDRLLAGMLLFLKDESNRDHPVMLEIQKYLGNKGKSRSQNHKNDNKE